MPSLMLMPHWRTAGRRRSAGSLCMSLRVSPCGLPGAGGGEVIVLLNSGSELKNKLSKSQGVGAASLLRPGPRNRHSVISAIFCYSEWSQSTSSSKEGT